MADQSACQTTAGDPGPLSNSAGSIGSWRSRQRMRLLRSGLVFVVILVVIKYSVVLGDSGGNPKIVNVESVFLVCYT